MRLAISADDEQDGLYHYLPDGGNLTACGLEAHQVIPRVPEDRSICRVCKDREDPESSPTLVDMNDEALVSLGWDLIREGGNRENQLQIINEAVARGLPVCRGTRQGGPHVATPLLRLEGQSIPCPLCGDIKFS